MKRPQFAERQYETAVNIELARGAASPFVPTQHAEFYLGIDAAHSPRDLHAIWRILAVQMPRRVMLSPMLWPTLPPRFHDEIPGRHASLFLQYKASVHQDHRRAKHFTRMEGPYYEVRITAHQQRRLADLEARVAAGAIVRYAAPAFWSRGEFDRHDERREVLRHSAFVSPSLVKAHRKWMFGRPTGKAVFNPDPEETDGESWEIAVRRLSEVGRHETLRAHVRALAAAVSQERAETVLDGDGGWVDRIRRYGRLSQEDAAFLLDLSTVTRAADAAGADWTVFLEPDPAWRFIEREGPGPFWWWWPNAAP